MAGTSALRWLDPLLDLVFPAICPVCQSRSDDPPHRPFCGTCWAALPRVAAPVCARCGAGYPGLGAGLVCDACRRAPPPYAFARAVAEYRAGMRLAIHALKYGPGLVTGVNIQWQDGKQVTVWPTANANAKVKFPSFVKLPQQAASK